MEVTEKKMYHVWCGCCFFKKQNRSMHCVACRQKVFEAEGSFLKPIEKPRLWAEKIGSRKND